MRGNQGVVGGICPNPQCKKKLYFPSHEASVECTGCGQRHTQAGLKNLGLTEWYGLGAIERLLHELQKESHRTTAVNQEHLKVNGLSNYLCTILSSLLTTYGMDRMTGRAKLLTEMGKPPVFDCAQLGDRAFLIDPQHLSIPGYGRDRSGSDIYLKDTLEHIKVINENEERLVPIHADGDGHCLVHAVSRALVGWELFWHSLRVNLKQHFTDNLSKYKMQFQDFIDDTEWNLIIRECDPEFVPMEAEPTGLRNIHIFGLANVLKRPIVLLDSLEGIQSPGDYSAIFLPYFSPPSECMNKEGVLNKPLCIAWSSLGRNHFIPLVGVQGRKCPVLSRHMIYRTWGVSDSEIDKYVSFDSQGNFQIGGEKVLQSGYLQRLVAAMSDIFFQQNGVSASLIADVYQQIFKTNGLMFGMNLNLLLEKTKTTVTDKQLFVCLTCRSLALAETVREEWLRPGGELYELAVSCHKTLKDGQKYSFPAHDVIAEYSASQNKLISSKSSRNRLSCEHCRDVNLRLVRADYTIEYINGDRTSTKSSTSPSGYKHFWNGKEYDTIPKQIPVVMEWGGHRVETKIQWFQDEEDTSLNSNVYNIAMSLVQENFPGEFGSERLVQKVVDQILRQTNKPEVNKPPLQVSGSASSSLEENDPGAWSPHRASKAILSGQQRQSVHKEELNKSAAERQLKQRIESNAPKQQRKLSDQTERKYSSPSPEQSSRKTPERRMSSPSSLSTTRIPISQTASATAGVGSVVGGSGAHQEPASTNKRIRLSTSDGRNITLDLPSECTFLELQSLICQAVTIPPSQQCIRHGFPPRELKSPATPDEDYKVPIQPGDKIMLDILAPKPEPSHKASPADISQSHAPDKSKIHCLPVRKEVPSWNTFAEGGMDEASDRVLQGLMDPLWTSGGDNLDHSLSALALTAALDNKDLWTYVQLRPHLFSVNGLFYKQVERDVGLKHGKHCQLPLLPHKVFVYNQFDDRLELCLEPYGHFPIESNVERNVGSMLPSSKCSSKSSHQPFSGQGHSLKSATGQEERMPSDVPMSPKRHEARRLNTFCDPTIHQESIEEEDEETAEAAKDEVKEEDCITSKLSSHRMNSSQLSRNLPLTWGTPGNLNLLMAPESRLVRKGPGYSELSPIPENVCNERTEMLQQLVSSIEQACETMGQEAQAISEAKELSPNHVHSSLSTSTTTLSADRGHFAPLVCTSSSLSLSQPEKLAKKSNNYDTLSFTKTSPFSTVSHLNHTTASLGSPACQLVSHSSTAGTVHSAFLSRSHTEVTSTYPNEHIHSVTGNTGYHNDNLFPGKSNISPQAVSEIPGRDIITQTPPHTISLEQEQVTGDSGYFPGLERSDLLDKENKVAEVKSSMSEHCDQSIVQMDAECFKEDNAPMEDEETTKTEETSKDLDDLFIVEPSFDTSVSSQHSDIPISEQMESP